MRTERLTLDAMNPQALSAFCLHPQLKVLLLTYPLTGTWFSLRHNVCFGHSILQPFHRYTDFVLVVMY